MRAHCTSTKWLGNVMYIQRSVTKRRDANMCAMMSIRYMLRIYPSRGFNPMWLSSEFEKSYVITQRERKSLTSYDFFEYWTPILKLNILVVFITNCKPDGTIPSRSHGSNFLCGVGNVHGRTNNIVCSVTYYMDFRDPRTIYYISHFLLAKVKLVVWTSKNIKKNTWQGWH